MGQYIFAACVRYVHSSLDDLQVQFLFLQLSRQGTKQVVDDPKNAGIRNDLDQDLVEEEFSAVWIVKHPSLGASDSKVLLWFHGTTPLLLHYIISAIFPLDVCKANCICRGRI